MFVLWFLVILGVITAGIGISYLVGDKAYDKTKDVIKAFAEEDMGEKENEISE